MISPPPPIHIPIFVVYWAAIVHVMVITYKKHHVNSVILPVSAEVVCILPVQVHYCIVFVVAS